MHNNTILLNCVDDMEDFQQAIKSQLPYEKNDKSVEWVKYVIMLETL